MNRATSVYLDAIRFLAAFAVFVGHISGERFTAGLFWQVGPYGSEAVDVFFVLSGFVIAYVADGRENTPFEYAVSRAARIYSVAIPALVTTFILDAIGRAIDPGLYSAAWGYAWDGRGEQFLRALLFLNETWFSHVSVGSDLPYWSLGYEVWYYVIFGVAFFAPRGWRIGGAIVLLALAGPKIAALFPIWLLGALSYWFCRTRQLRLPVAAILCFGSIALWVAYEIHCWRYGRPIAPNWIGKPDIVQDYVIGILFTLHLLGFRFISMPAEPLLRSVERPIRWVAGATLTLYLFHLPIAQFLAAITLWPARLWATRLLLFAGIPALVFLIAAVTERRKSAWRRGIRHALGLPNVNRRPEA